MEEPVKPYNSSENKKEQVARMFDNISGRYDMLNHLLSLNIDKLWRRRARRLLAPYKPQRILDVATGTGDFAFELLKLEPEYIVGIDISAGMLEQGRIKAQERFMGGRVSLEVGDAEHMSFQSESFDAVTVAFGVRNFEDIRAGLREIHRVLKPGFPLVVLEFSKPTAFPMAQLYNVYFHHILPWVGSIVSRDKRAYSYLPESVQAFPEGSAFSIILADCGFKRIRVFRLTFGVATIYIGEK